ncbi:MAG: hypothetical protein KGK08_10335 [Acidobacteriota bacterium]|nr:hypothetical protein [Acidobacteriota bacterium]
MLVATGTAQTAPTSALLSQPPRSWVVDATANEVIALHHENSYIRYRMRVVDEKGDMMRDVVESKDGAVARLIERDGKPLTPEQDAAERQRLADMVASPADFARHIRNDDTGKRLADQLLRLMPDAMVYTYTPGQPQSGLSSQTEIVLDYHPNPHYHYPSTTSEALSGLEGRVWINAQTRQVVQMTGHIFRAVNLGWGILAHLYPGGTLLYQQVCAGGSRYIFSHFEQHLTVRALLLKSFTVNTNISGSDFSVLPGPMPYQQAIQLLLQTPLPRH